MKNLILSFLLLLPLASIAGKKYSVTVVVKSLDGLKPIEGVTVEYYFKGNVLLTALTNAEGKASFSDCKAKDFLLKCKPVDQIYASYEMGFGNSEKENMFEEVFLAYAKEKEIEFLASKFSMTKIDTALITVKCLNDFKEPEYPGGRNTMVQFLQKNLVMPSVAEELGIKGKVYLKFFMDEDGNISYIEVTKGILDCPECDAEAVRMIAYMPKWEPATCDGTPTNCIVTLTLIFNVF